MDRQGGVSLRARVGALAAVGVLVLVVVGVLVWSAYADVLRVGAEVAQRLSPAQDAAADLVVDYDRVDVESRGFVVTGDPDARAAYETARSRVASDTETLRRLLDPDPALRDDLARVEAAGTAWLTTVVEPAVEAREAGALTDAEVAAFLDATSTGYAGVSGATTGLQDAVSAERDASFDELTAVARSLSLALLAAGIALLALLGSAYALVRAWVLTPLDVLRRQLRDVAREERRHQVITPTGPPELRAAGADAEAMRRALVAEADAARAADESLEMQGPVVAALRSDLAPETDPVAARLRVHGQLHPATGVLAGDWWGVVPLDRERTGLVLIDVSGHGPLAGLVTLRLRAVMSVALRSGFDPATVLERASTSFAGSADGRFATALVLILDPAGESLTWANAGHPAGWLLPAGRTEGRVPLSPTGPLLSELGGRWTTRSADLWVDDVVMAWSDGLVETRAAASELSDDALAAVIDGIGTREPAELVTALIARLRSGAPEWRRDDITALAALRTS